MIKHIVAWKLKDNAEGMAKTENAIRIKELLENLKNLIPQIVDIEVGINFNTSDSAYDVALYSVFKSETDLNVYQVHPEHLKVAEFVRKVVEKRVVIDYKM